MERAFFSALGAAVVLVGFLVTSQAAAATFGYPTVGAAPDVGDSNYMNAWKFTTSSTQSGTITSMSVYVSGPVSAAPNNKLQVAVYSDSGNAPGSRLAVSASKTIAANAWNTVAVSTTLSPGTTYWLAYNTNGVQASDNNVPFDASTQSRQVWRARAFGSWPATFGAVEGSSPVVGSIYATYVPPDASPPTTPTNLTAGAASPTRIDLSWSASSDNVGVTGYRVYRDGAQIATTAATSYSSTGLSPSTTYSFTVAAYDAAGNVSPQSASASARTLDDVTPPTVSITAPANGATISATVTVSATASDDVGVAGVRFRRDGTDFASEDLSPPYSASLDTTTLSDGAHTLTAVARDAAGNTATSQPVNVTVDNSGGGPQPLLHQSDLTYVGAFLLPSSSLDSTSFSYGGTAVAYSPTASSLFVVGHDWYQRTAEVSIPPAVNSSSLSDLNTAALLQPFADATNGKIDQTGGNNNKIGGQLVYQGRLYGTAYIYYDASGSQVVSHWSRPGTSLSSGTASGLFQVGTLGAGFVSGYLTEIPAAWQGPLGGPALTGNCCLSIISRTSYGPAAFAFDPLQLGAVSPVPDTPLVYYPSDHTTLGGWSDSWNPSAGILFNGTTTIRGVVFPAGSASVLFFGTQGTGRFCYGEGTSDPSLDGKPTPDGSTYCYDPDSSSKGTHGYPYVPEVWAYDANQLAAVRSGQTQPWDVRPYATWPLSLPFGSSSIGGAAYDPASHSVYVSQQYGNGPDPVIHVFRVP